MKYTDRLIRLPEVIELVGLKRTAIYKMIKAGQFPKQVRLGVASLWAESEVSEWIEQQKMSREAA